MNSISHASTGRLFALALAASLPTCASADIAEEFEDALSKWQLRGMRNYSFVYRDASELLGPLRCGDALILVQVRNGVGELPVVIVGGQDCPEGTRGEEIGLTIPRTIDEAFEKMRPYIIKPTQPVSVDATFNRLHGAPLWFVVRKLTQEDADEGFYISDFTRL
jgi:hypothetical protein